MGIMEGKKKEVWHLENDPPKQALGFSKMPALHR
jgi:hypothetical protein